LRRKRSRSSKRANSRDRLGRGIRARLLYKMPSVIPDLDAPIVPGVSCAGILVGTEMGALSSVPEPALRSDQIYRFHHFQSVRVLSVRGIVVQVGALEGYRGLLDGKIGIGSTIAEVEEWCACRVEEGEDDELVATGMSGWCFETDEWKGNHTVAMNRESRITAIFVHAMGDHCELHQNEGTSRAKP
jgi:hypothetical protein